jgi:hypothetical protein
LNAIKGINFGQGTYQNSDADFDNGNDIAGVITPAKVNVKASTFNLVKSAGKSEITVVSNDSTPFTFYEGTLSNKLSSKITVNTISLLGTGVGTSSPATCILDSVAATSSFIDEASCKALAVFTA